MKLRASRVPAAVILGLCVLTATANANGRLYSGDPLKPSEVALVTFVGEFWVSSITKEGEPEKPLMLISSARRMIGLMNSTAYVVEVLPGHYSLCVSSQSQIFGTSGRVCDLALDAQPGRVYYVDIHLDLPPPDSREAGRWVPKIRDIDSPDLELPFKNRRKSVDNYWRSPRPVLSRDEKDYWK
jgi:hypothetical protein